MLAIKPRASPRTKPVTQDAIALLEADHEAVNQLFADYEAARSLPSQQALLAKICTALLVHAKIEEEIFYPAVKAELRDKWLVSEAIVEHAGVRNLICLLRDPEASGPTLDAKVKQLLAHVRHHVREEQNELFTRARASSLDMIDLGARLAARKQDLLAALGAANLPWTPAR